MKITDTRPKALTIMLALLCIVADADAQRIESLPNRLTPPALGSYSNPVYVQPAYNPPVYQQPAPAPYVPPQVIRQYIPVPQYVPVPVAVPQEQPAVPQQRVKPFGRSRINAMSKESPAFLAEPPRTVKLRGGGTTTRVGRVMYYCSSAGSRDQEIASFLQKNRLQQIGDRSMKQMFPDVYLVKMDVGRPLSSAPQSR
ncbi:MAG: hypothetical protein H0W20_01905 [Chthoniobacterales bacterium]|nr:hypothetical protein [Chthoniobacterales bacterium]